MAGQFVGGAVFSAFLQVAFDRLATREVMDFACQWKIDLVEVENLKTTSAKIQALADDAEVKQFTNPVVKLWLNHLKQLLYDAEDILDAYVTDILRVKLESESQTHPDRQVRYPVSLTTPPSSSESSTTVLSSLSSGIESVVKGFINQTLDGIQSIPQKVYDIYEELRGIKEYSSKVKELNDKLKRVAKEGSDLGLSSGIRDATSRSRVFSQRPPTSSMVNKDKVCGREKDKEEIIEFLLRDDNNENFSVLPIVGMGGLGKTTLAQLVYADGSIMNHFHLRAWVCVSEEFDIVRITKEILESATGRKPDSDLLDRLQNQLQVVLSNKKFLLVLDDVWNLNYDKWDILQTPFAAGARGSKILVTTRDHRISSMMRKGVTPHQLKPLSDEACINLLHKHAFVDGNSSEAAGRKLEMFGREVVERCKGLPLAVKTIAGLLRYRTDDGEWKAVLENEIWDLEEDESDILPSLMLSYHHLPPHLKRCFACCALFPKDYEFDKIELVRLWMAEGLIVHPRGTKRLEDIGVGYFVDLFQRSFFDLSNRPTSDDQYDPSTIVIESMEHDPYYSSRKEGFFDDRMYYELSWCLDIKSFSEVSNISGSSRFVMHDLIHDLAQFVSGETYFREEGNKPSKINPVATRHLSYDHGAGGDGLVTNFRDIKEMKSLRTLLKYGKGFYGDCFHEAFYQISGTTHQFLRVLCLNGYKKLNLPDSIGNLKHLRLLDLSCSSIMSLPVSIARLYNLQTLILFWCHNLRELPKDMGDLANLRHLFLPTTLAQKLPLRCGRLTNLQTLNEFGVGLHAKIGELRDLSQLRGSLRISNLEKVGNYNGTDEAVEAVEANLKNKPHLRELGLCWSTGSKDSFPDSRDEKVEEDVLEQLQPHTNLEMLRIENYGGTRFPSWVGHHSFSNLATVLLSGCHKCICLPSLGQLPSLKHLKIDGCSALNIAGSESCGSHDDLSVFNKQFRSLETLVICGMIDWEDWSEEQQVDVEGEEQVGGVEEEFPCLRKLRIRDCPKLRRIHHRFSGLLTATIENCNELSEIPRLLPSLQQLKILKCEKLVVFPTAPSIQILVLETCRQITLMSDDDDEAQHPYSSSSSSSSSSSPVPLHVCNSKLVEDPDEEEGEGEFRCLRELYIFRCPNVNMRKLPRTLPSVVKLHIEACEELSSIPMLPLVKDLRLGQCNERLIGKVSDILSSSSLSTLHLKGISSSNLSSLPGGFFQHQTTLEQLEIHSFSELMMVVGLQLLTSLRCLEFNRCPKLQTKISLLPDNDDEEEEEGDQGLILPSSLEYLKFSYCDSLKKLPQSLCDLHRLNVLEIEGASGLESLPEGLHKLTSLERLTISKCPRLVSLAEMKLPIGLQFLSIVDFDTLKALPEGLHKLTSLEFLRIDGCPALESFPDMGLPTMLRSISIQNCGKVNSLPKGLDKLRNLETLKIMECSFLEEYCKNLGPLQTSGLLSLTSLRSLTIGGCPALKSIPKGLLLSNLRDLFIQDCPILESLHDGLSHLTSLDRLYIENCPQLAQRYQTKKGEEWSKIAQIPHVRIDNVWQ